MAAPIINNISPFDARLGTTITFSYTGTQPTGIQLEIYKSDTLALIYRNMNDSAFERSGTTPVNLSIAVGLNSGLVNGSRYYARLRVIDANKNISQWSNSSFFFCFATSTLIFDGISDGDTIHVQALPVAVKYHQDNDEPIQSYWFNLYDANKILISTSPTYYDTSEKDENEDTVLRYTFTNLIDDVTYHLRCMGTTIHGMSCDSGYVRILADYHTPEDYSMIYLSNDETYGYIKYQGNLKIIQATEENNFDYTDGYIHLEDQRVTYESGYNIEADFILWLKGYVAYDNKVLLILSNLSRNITLESVVYDDFMRFKLCINNGMDTILYYSNSVPAFIDYETEFIWCIKRLNNVYELKVFELPHTTGTVYVGSTVPTQIALPGVSYIEDTDSTIAIRGNNITHDVTEPEVVVPTIWTGGEK